MEKSDFISQNFGFYGCSCYNECPKSLLEDNLVLMGLNYHSHYEDDDCGFTYINTITGKLSYNIWTTAAACPTFRSYLRVWWQDAIDSGMISKEMVWNTINELWMEAIEEELKSIERQSSFYYVASRYGITNINVPCVVSNRCHGYKGKGILLRFVEVDSSFTNAYGRRIHLTDHKAKVLGEDGNIHTIGHRLVHVDMNTIVRKFRGLVNDDFESTTIWASIFPFVHVDLSGAKDLEEDAMRVKYEEFKASKMPGLITWCRSKKPEETDENIEAWASKIFAHKYPMV